METSMSKLVVPVKNLENLTSDILQVVDRMFVTDHCTKGSNIVEFYKGKCVLITGGSGFLGKVLIEKLLRTCKGLEKIFLLCRKKRGKEIEERMKDLFDSPLFEKLEVLHPNYRDRVFPIAGDVGEPGLGFTSEDRNLLISKVNIIFHVAATVKFDEQLRKAVTVNIMGTKEMLRLARDCSDFRSFVYVSTAFSYCIHKEIDERFYEPPMEPSEIIELIQTKTDEDLNKLSRAILGKWPNTYTFTKAIAEATVKQFGAGLPICITRPSIVVSTYNEPYRCFVDSPNGPAGAFTAGALGFLKVFYARHENKSEIVPVDFVINNMITAAYNNDAKKTNNIPIYNYVTCMERGMPLSQFCAEINEEGMQLPPISSIWYPTIIWTTSGHVFRILAFLLHSLPALILDLLCVLIGKKKQFVLISDKVIKYMAVTSYFLVNSWTFKNDNVKTLWDGLSAVDKSLFPFDMSVVDWSYYAKMYAVGIRTYLIKESLSTIQGARKKLWKLYMIHCITRGVFIMISLWVLYKFCCVVLQ